LVGNLAEPSTPAEAEAVVDDVEEEASKGAEETPGTTAAAVPPVLLLQTPLPPRGTRLVVTSLPPLSAFSEGMFMGVGAAAMPARGIEADFFASTRENTRRFPLLEAESKHTHTPLIRTA
jgi:PAB1-binding protein PBP1